MCLLLVEVPVSDLCLVIQRLQLTANDHFGVVPCLAAHRALADTLATYSPPPILEASCPPLRRHF